MVMLTAAQATMRYLANQFVAHPSGELPYFAGVWAIFGHGNVASMSEALQAVRDVLPTYRAHNEQAMAHSAIAFAKQARRRRAMVCTSSIGPGATNMITAAALAHVDRLPVLFLPGDVYASRRPDPVLQQIETFHDGTVSANDCFRPVSRFFDRIMRPEQLLDALPRALATMIDPASCGPVTLAFCQDVQAEAWDFPRSFFEPHHWSIRAPRPSRDEMDALVAMVKEARTPLIVAGGGVLYSGAEESLARLAETMSIPVATTQAGKGAMVWQHPMSLGGIGVTGTSGANEAAAGADLIIGIGTRLQDFTTGSRALFANRKLVQVNVAAFDAHKHGAFPVVGDAGAVLDELMARLSATADGSSAARTREAKAAWNDAFEKATNAPEPGNNDRPSDAQVLGAVWRQTPDDTVVVCAAGGLPGELHKLWPVRSPGGYHVEYGYSCMGYEIAAGIGVKLAEPERAVVVLVGDGSYLMMNSELATAVAMGLTLTVVILDNRGFGCIDRLQRATGNRPFNNLLPDGEAPQIDFAAHAASLGAAAEKASGIDALEAALARARQSGGCHVIVIETDPSVGTEAGGAWWDVAVPEVSEEPAVRNARAAYEQQLARIAKGEAE